MKLKSETIYYIKLVTIYDWVVSFIWQEQRKDELLGKYFPLKVIIFTQGRSKMK